MDLKDGGVVEAMKQLKLNHQFNEKDVPQIFKALINDRMSGLKEVQLVFNDSTSLLIFDDSQVRFKMKYSNVTITYKDINTTIVMLDPEKSIIDHLWFILKNPNIKLKTLNIIETENSKAENRHSPKIDKKKLYTILQSMFDSIDHQIETNDFAYEGLSEDALLAMLQHVKPRTLENIILDVSLKEEGGNCQKLMGIVETDQWKQAKTISSRGVTPFKIDDFFHCEKFWLELASVSPEDVLRVVEVRVEILKYSITFFQRASNAPSEKYCRLTYKTEKVDNKAMFDFLRSQNNGSRITKALIVQNAFDIVKSGSGKRVLLVFDENNIAISGY
ncbi:hypothetical protein CAEBREN_00554 [Caenorhabditis brenneri]|uniref:DUF38 domain-containing protein n=1 Tax=Caenorhabditis brenneri TaxID=135651 RepID=G0P288_CAEBE|nr:hypothetical protein CAEBREN_00554 [Caenorhabditis brenneri]